MRASSSARTASVKNSKQALRRLFAYLKPYQIGLVAVFLLIALSAVFMVSGPYLLGQAIDRYIAQKDLAGLAIISLKMAAVYAGMWISGVSYGRLMAKIAQKAMYALRRDLETHLQTLSLNFFDRQSTGDLMSRLTNDMDAISNLLSQNIAQFFNGLFSLISVLTMMIILNGWLTLAALSTLPIMFALVAVVGVRARPAFRNLQKSLGKLNGLMEENLSGQQVVIAYGQQDAAIADFTAANADAKARGINAQTLTGVMMPLMMVLGNLNMAVVAGAGAFMAINGIGGVTVGLIAAFINYARNMARPINQMSNLYFTIIAALAGAERIFDVLDEVPAVQDAPNAAPLVDAVGRVEFENVYFSYNPDTPVLKNISLHAKPGEMIALVGPTGAGKTTLINVLTRFYDIQSGEITIDGHEIKTLQQDSLRRQLGIVLQEMFLFSATVMENIRYGNLEATDEEVIAAAKMANADQFIRRLPHGYQTELTERGNNLSQGQRQLLAIARAILADPRILILDEATSSVDTRTEARIQEALLRLMAGRASFVIAHRLSAVRSADAILVLNNGEIIERGTHNNLLAQKGFYYNLYISQFRGQDHPDEQRALQPPT